jgi:hypothetical protein
MYFLLNYKPSYFNHKMNQSSNIIKMEKSLFTLCMEKLASTHNKDLHKKIPTMVYYEYVKYLMEKGYYNWKNKINLVNMELNIENIEVEQDMYFDELTYHIFVKKRFNDIVDEDELDEDEYDENEYVMYHEFRDDPVIYDNYLEIAKKRGMLVENDIEEYNFNEIYVDF